MSKQTFTVKKLSDNNYTVLARGDNQQGLTATVPIFTINGREAKSDCDVIAFHLNKVMEVELNIELEERRKQK